MRSDKTSKAKPRKNPVKRILTLLLALIVVLIVLIFFLVPAFISSGKCRRLVLSRINKSVAGKTDFAGLTMGWFKGISIANLSFSDNADQISVQVKQITTKPHYFSILAGNLSFGETIIDKPRVQVHLKDQQFGGPGSFQQEPSTVEGTRVVILPILPARQIDLVLNDGNLKITNSETQTLELSKINSTLTISLSGEYPTGQTDKLLSNLTANANLSFEKASYMGLDFGSTDVDIQIRNGLLKIAPFETIVNEGRFNFAGQVDFNQKPAQLKIAEPLQLMKNIKINEQTTEKLLVYLNPIFADAVNAAGIADFSCEQLIIPLTAAARNQAEVVGTISINQLRLQASGLLNTIFSVGGTSARGADITIRPTKFVLRDGFLRYDDMQMDIGDNPVNFKGVIGLDKSLDMTVTLPYTTDGRTVRIGRETSGQRIKVSLRGTVDRPELDIGKLFEGQLMQQLEEQLPNILEELLK